MLVFKGWNVSFFIHEEEYESSPDVAFELCQNLEDQESVAMFSTMK